MRTSTTRRGKVAALLAAGALVLGTGAAASAQARPAAGGSGDRGSMIADPKHRALPSGPAGAVAVAPADAPAGSVPASCGVRMWRVNGGKMWYLDLTGTTTKTSSYGPILFGGVARVPRTMSYVGRVSNKPLVNQWIATFSDGSMWRVRTTAGAPSVATSKVASSGWAGIKILTQGGGDLLYGVTSAGAVLRYKISLVTGAATGAGKVTIDPTLAAALTTMTWKIGYISTDKASHWDAFYATTTAGDLRELWFGVEDRSSDSSVLKPTGWLNAKALSSGVCATATTTSPTVPILMTTSTGDVYGYLDRNNADGLGADIKGLGKVFTGFTGFAFGS